MSPQQDSPEPLLLSHTENGIRTLTLNRPDQYNALSGDLLDALGEALDTAAADDETRVVILAANGKAFCAGHDLRQMREHADRRYINDLFVRCSKVMMKLVALPQPVIARVQGMATAAGCQLVATCDLAVAAESAKFAVSGIRVGLFCSTPAVALSRNVSRKRAMEMLLTGDFIDAGSALEYGLLNHVVPAEKLDAAVMELANKIADQPPRVIRIGKENFYRQLEQELPEAYESATESISGNMMLPETLEGIDAFLEKRKPQWPR